MFVYSIQEIYKFTEPAQDFSVKDITQFFQIINSMTIAQTALEGFLYLLGGLVASFVIAEAIQLYNEKQRNESFTTAVDTMTKSTVVAIESIKDTTTTAINALLDMSALHDVNALAREKAKENNANTTPANK